uniref:Uncharacterized protein n=1 Tax=Rhizophora mucronata TaxID=61149 RepID=A0A2P2MZX3_RHIMU
MNIYGCIWTSACVQVFLWEDRVGGGLYVMRTIGQDVTI